LGGISIFLIMGVFIAPENIWVQSCVFLGCLLLFGAYISYEHRKPLDDVIRYLEEVAIAKKYQLAFQQQPQHISIALNPMLFISHLKRQFPVFNQGSLRNDILLYASSYWTD